MEAIQVQEYTRRRNGDEAGEAYMENYGQRWVEDCVARTEAPAEACSRQHLQMLHQRYQQMQ